MTLHIVGYALAIVLSTGELHVLEESETSSMEECTALGKRLLDSETINNKPIKWTCVPVINYPED